MTIPPVRPEMPSAAADPALAMSGGFVITRENAPQVSNPEDLALVKERNLHDHDMQYRRAQLAVAKFGIAGVGLLGAVCVVIGIWTADDKVFQFGTGIMATILGLALGFLFPRT